MMQPRMVCLVLAVSIGLALLGGLGAQETGDPPPADAAPPDRRRGTCRRPAQIGEGGVRGRTGRQWKGLVADLVVLRTKYPQRRRSNNALRSGCNGRNSSRRETRWSPKLIACRRKGIRGSAQCRQGGDRPWCSRRCGGTSTPSRFRPQTEDYERALRVGRLLTDNKCDDKCGSTTLCGAGRVCDVRVRRRREVPQTGQSERHQRGRREGSFPWWPSARQAWQREQKLRTAEAAAAEADKLPRVVLKTNRGDLVCGVVRERSPQHRGQFHLAGREGILRRADFPPRVTGLRGPGRLPQGRRHGRTGLQDPLRVLQARAPPPLPRLARAWG